MLVIRNNFRHFLVTVKINYDLNITDLGSVPFPFLSGLLLTDTEQCKVDIVDNNLFCSRFIRSINVNIANIPPVKLVQCCSSHGRCSQLRSEKIVTVTNTIVGDEKYRLCLSYVIFISKIIFLFAVIHCHLSQV